MFAIRQSQGSTPVSRDFWKMHASTGEIGSATSYRTLGWISSGPAALVVFRPFNNL